MNNGIVSINIMKYLNVTDCEIYKKVNNHGKAEIKGYIDEKFLQDCENCAISEKWAAINEYYNGENVVIFSGIINSFEIEYINGYHQVTIEIYGQTYEMDLLENTRIFQSDSTSIDEICNRVNSSYGAQQIIGGSCSGSLGHMSVQYMETDWNYLKRIASEKKSFIMPYYKLAGCKYMLGHLGGEKREVKTKNYKVRTRVISYENKVNNGVRTSINDENQYIYKTRDLFDLGDNINFNGLNLYVYEVSSKLIKEEIINEYVLMSKSGFSMKTIPNYNIIGLSLDGIVNSVSSDMVSVNFTSNESTGSRMYKYATVYSSTSGAGWYCMPECGDTVRIYFPTENENDAYAINSAHISMGDKSPGTTFIRTPSNKEIVFTDKQLKITNNAGASIILDDDKGILIDSKNGINIKSDKNVDMISNNDKILVSALSEVKLQQGDSKVTVNDNVNIKGQQVHIQKV